MNSLKATRRLSRSPLQDAGGDGEQHPHVRWQTFASSLQSVVGSKTAVSVQKPSESVHEGVGEGDGSGDGLGWGLGDGPGVARTTG